MVQGLQDNGVSLKSAFNSPTLSDLDFSRLSEFIHAKCGIKLTPQKKVLLEVRLQKRLRVLSMTSFREYVMYLFSDKGMLEELVHMIDVVTTNKTDFIREPWHFEFLVNKGIPKMMKESRVGLENNFRIWSAGCSSGEEPYTLAMILSEFALKHSKFKFDVLATDISTQVLARARIGIYKEEVITPVSSNLRDKYLLRSKDKKKGLARVSPQIRALVTFRRLNFLDGDYGISGKLDVIFCRNVFIYFDKKTQATILRKFCEVLKMGGYLLIGHSETLAKDIGCPLTQVAPTIYLKTA